MKRDPHAVPPAPAPAAAKLAGLRYVRDDQPGIARRLRGKHFRYLDADGSTVTDEDTLARIKALVIPPAWAEVWICKHPLGHLQATGRDARGRKQYRYHARWRSHRDEAQYARMLSFGKALPEGRIPFSRQERRASRGERHDRRLARIISRMRDLPGQELFQYEDDDGNPHAVDWSDVNDYLQAVTGADYTAKDFRTWAGTILSPPVEAAVLALLQQRLE